MKIIKTYYLIDFENVNNAGLICSRHLDYHDHIHIFSTKNAPKISIEILSNFHSVDYSFHCLPAGKQSLDMHLTAYLGYLLGTNGDKKCKYVIIRKTSRPPSSAGSGSRFMTPRFDDSRITMFSIVITVTRTPCDFTSS